MLREEFQLELENYQLTGTWFLPHGQVKATAHLIHGQGDFIGRYHEVAKIFTSYGIAVCGVDFPGHGKSSGKRGDIPSLSSVENILSLTREKIEQRFPVLPRGLMAHSMGGLMGLRSLTQDEHYHDFCWLSSPLLRPSQNKSQGEISLLKKLSHFMPKLTVSTGVKRDLCRRVPNAKKGTHKNNPLFHKKISLRWGKALLDAENALHTEGATSFISAKTLITQGSRDRITPLRFAKEFMTQKAWSNLEMRVINNALHEPFRDITRAECFLVIQDWIEAQVCPIISCDGNGRRFLVNVA